MPTNYLRLVLWLFVFINSNGNSAYCQFSNTVSFKRYTTSDGLPDNNVRSLMFDSNGFLWIGTEEGLVRFDGEEFLRFPMDPQFTTYNVINEILEDESGQLWIATQDGGIIRFNPITKEVFHPTLPGIGQVEQKYTYTLALIPNGGIMVGTDKGIYYSHDRKEFFLYDDRLKAACYRMITVDNHIVTAEARHGSRIFNHQLEPVKQQITDSNNTFLNTIYRDRRGNYWIGSWNSGLYLKSSQSSINQSFDYSGQGLNGAAEFEVYRITELNENVLWVANRGGQLWEFNQLINKAAPLKINNQATTKLYGSKINCMLTDKYGRVWVGTNNGLHFYDKTSAQFETHYLHDNATVTSFEKINSSIYIGSLGGLYQFDEGEVKFLKRDINVYSMLAKNDQQLYLGTNHALQCMDIHQLSMHYPLSSPKGGTYLDVNQISASRFTFIKHYRNWLFANIYGYGLLSIDNQNRTWSLNMPTSNNGSDNLLNGAFVDSKNRMWLFGSMVGLIKADPWSLPQQPVYSSQYTWWCEMYSKGLQSMHITAMVELKDGNMYVSTSGGGLYRFNPDSERSMFERIETPFQTIRNMVSDLHGNIWMIASGALLNYNPVLKQWHVFDERNGIPKEGLNGSLFVDNQGEVFAGGQGFFIHFHPSLLEKNNELPHTTITHLRVMDQQRDEWIGKNEFRLPFNHNLLSIKFSSLCFGHTGSIKYSYRLLGIDDQWHDNGKSNVVTISGMLPGKYTFEVKAITQDNLHEVNPARLTFYIDYPFYAKWWFILSAALVLGSIVYFQLRTRKAHRHKLEMIRNRIARDLHDDIGSALGSISFFSEAAKRTMNHSDSKQTIHVLDKIGTTSREMIENMHDIVWAVNPNNDDFEHIALRMRNYASELAASNNILLKWDESDNLSSQKLSMSERKNLFLIFKESLYNSVKYASCTAIQVVLRRTSQGRLQLIISDDGVGFDPHAPNNKGNGLRNMRSRAAEIHAGFDLVSKPNKGTTITVTL